MSAKLTPQTDEQATKPVSVGISGMVEELAGILKGKKVNAGKENYIDYLENKYSIPTLAAMTSKIITK